MIATFIMWLGALAVTVGIAALVAHVVQTTWRWVERSDAERGYTFVRWYRYHR